MGRIFLFVMCIFLALLTNCSNSVVDNSDEEPKETVPHTNQPPTIVDFTYEPENINIDQTLQFECIATEPENDSLSYFWDSYKVTDASTIEDYEIIFSLNSGSFAETGKTAIWQPARLDGKYLIICYIKDIAGYEKHALTIVDVNLHNTLSLKTEMTSYGRNDDIIFWIKNEKYQDISLNAGLTYVESYTERLDDEEWIPVTAGSGGLFGFPVHVAFNDSVSSWATTIPWEYETGYAVGVYRIYVEFSNDNSAEYNKKLYSNEFEIVD